MATLTSNTVTFAELQRLAYYDSADLPRFVNTNGYRSAWCPVHNCWERLDEDPQPTDPVVMFDT